MNGPDKKKQRLEQSPLQKKLDRNSIRSGKNCGRVGETSSICNLIVWRHSSVRTFCGARGKE